METTYDIVSLLRTARESGISVFKEGEKLKFKLAKNKKPSTEVVQMLKMHKEEILEFLGNGMGNVAQLKAFDEKILPRDRGSGEKVPLSFSQERLWFIDQFQGSKEYNVHQVIRIQDELEKSDLESALSALVNRHEIFRTVIRSENGQPYQEVISADNWKMGYSLGEEFRDEEFLRLFIRTEAEAAFDLANDYTFRAHLIRLKKDDHLLVLIMHHISADGWSESILMRDLIELYSAQKEGRAPKLNKLPIQYADFAIWQRKNLSNEYLSTKLDWWEKQLKGVEALELPTDFERPLVQSMKGASKRIDLDQKLHQQLKGFCMEQELTMFQLMLAAFKVLLYRHSNQEDICVGTPLANRNLKELEPIVGFFINNLALRSQVNPHSTFIEFAKQVKRGTIAAFEHKDVPFEQIVDRIENDRNLSRTPIFQVVFSMLNTPKVPKLKLGGSQVSAKSVQQSKARYDLTIIAKESPEGLSVGLEYCSDLFTSETIELMIQHYELLLRGIIYQPDQKIGTIPFLNDAEKERLLSPNNTFQSFPEEKTLVHLFEDQVKNHPQRMALAFEQETWTYQELNQKVNTLAKHLQSTYALKADDLVGVMMERSGLAVISILAILKSGAAFVPIDVNLPDNRKIFMIEDTQIKTLLVSADSKQELENVTTPMVEVDQFFANNNKETIIQNWEPVTQSNDLAYIIYTSGSTGKPKGVMIEHAGIRNTILSLIDKLGITEEDHCLQFASMSFDASIWEMFTALLAGASLHVVDERTKTDTDLFAKYMNRSQISITILPPSFVNSFDLADFSHLRALVTGGEAAVKHKAIEFLKYGAFFNAYGPTEVSICATMFKAEKGSELNYKNIPIGRPLANTRLFIVDQFNNLVPIGVTGELCVAGDGLARGYLNRPKLTAEKFVKNHFSLSQRGKLYKTGDLCRRLPDGNIEFVGRLDAQVKIRGYRIELGEIENILDESPFVTKAVVLAKEDATGNKQLVAYIVPEGTFDKNTIKAYLSERLPTYMVPPFLLELSEMPLTNSGKIDKKALPELDISSLQKKIYAAPVNETEGQLSSIWKELLNLKNVGIHDNFFEIGGHSLLAMRVVAAIRNEMNLEITIKDIFNFSTIKELAQHLDTLGEGTALPALHAFDRPEAIPLSFAQERLWFIDQFEGSLQYHIPSVFRLDSNVDKAILEKAMQALVERHEVLRTIIQPKGEQTFQKVKPADEWQLAYSEGVEFVEEVFLEEFVVNEINTPFDLTADYMLRAHLVKIGDTGEHLLVMVIHHIASDGWSKGIIQNDLTEFYNAFAEDRDVNLASLPIQYADYALWQKKYLSEDYLNSRLDWWENKLKGVEPLELPLDYPRPARRTTRGADISFKIGKAEMEELKELSLNTGATMFITLLTVFKILLYRYSGQADICVGAPVANRNQKELEPLVGFFINSLALRSDLSGKPSFTELLERVKTTTLTSFSNQHVPFEKIVERVQADRSLSTSPIFQIMFVMQNAPESKKMKLSGLDMSKNPYKHVTSRYDMTFSVKETPEGLYFGMEYCTDLFARESMLRMLEHFKMLLSSIVANPAQQIGQLGMLKTSEREKLLVDFNQTTSNYPNDRSIAGLFEDRVTEIPENVALVHQGKKYTYGALNRKVNQMAHFLNDLEGYENDKVALCINRSVEMISAVLGTLKSGAAYVPINPKDPKERVQFILEDLSIKTVLCSATNKHLFADSDSCQVIVIEEALDRINQYSEENPEGWIKSDCLAYVMYTSGSTGIPKGVSIRQQSIARLIFNQSFDFLGKESVLYQYAPVSFDASTFEIWGALLKGGTLVLGNAENQTLEEIEMDLQLNKVNTLWLTAGLFHLAVDTHIDLFKGLDYILAGGDSIRPRSIQKVLSHNPGLVFINGYGPTESTTFAIINSIDDPGKIALNHNIIGKPIGNTKAYVLDKTTGNLIPQGYWGELCLSGPGLALGYNNREELTQQKFKANPFENGAHDRLYFTGDRVRWLPDGTLEFKGRFDEQIKVRGHRIELGEIENVLQKCDWIDRSVTMTFSDAQGNKNIVAYVVPNGEFQQEPIMDYLAAKLPDYMIPSLLIEIAEIPLTTNGKVDKRALPEPDFSLLLKEGDQIAPRNKAEEKLAKIWKEVLSLKELGVFDNFFDIGGQSINALTITHRIKEEFNTSISVADFFANPTIAGLTQLIDTEANVDTLFSFYPVQEDKANLFFIPPVLGTPVVFTNLANELSDSKNCFGLEYYKLEEAATLDDSIEQMALRFTKDILSVQSEGLFSLCGYSMGATIAFEITKNLEKLGHKVALTLMDRGTWSGANPEGKTGEDEMEFYLDWFHSTVLKGSVEPVENEKIQDLIRHNIRILDQYEMTGHIKGDILALEASHGRRTPIMKHWKNFTAGAFQHEWLKGQHHEILDREHVLNVKTILLKNTF